MSPSIRMAVLSVFALLVTLAPAQSVFAQGVRLTTGLALQTQRTIRQIENSTIAGTAAIERIQNAAVSQLLRLGERGVSDNALNNLANHYKRTSTLLRNRYVAQIDRQYSSVFNRLRSVRVEESQSLVDDLNAARESGRADLISTEAESLGSIDEALAQALVLNG